MKPLKSAFVGNWRIVEMEQWAQSFVDAEDPGYVTFEKNGLGHFHFGYVHVQVDWRYDAALTRVDFSFEGNDDCRPTSGRGWARIAGKQLIGQIVFHLGEESGFKAQRAGKNMSNALDLPGLLRQETEQWLKEVKAQKNK